MRYDICSACQFFNPLQITLEERIPKHCSCPRLRRIFGRDVGGFPTGVDIIHCDDFAQIPIDFGDVKILSDEIRNFGVSYVLTQPRKFKVVRCPQLYDNSKNIKTILL